MVSTKLTANRLKAIISACPKRHYMAQLLGVIVDFDKKRIIATNTHIMIVADIFDSIPDDLHGIHWVDTKSIKNVLKGAKKDDEIHFGRDNFYGIAYGDRMVAIYPDYNKVIPRDDQVRTNSFEFYDPKYISIIDKVLTAYEIRIVECHVGSIGRMLCVEDPDERFQIYLMNTRVTQKEKEQ